MLGISLSSLYNLANSGAIAHYRFGKRAIRFDEDQIKEYMESCLVAKSLPKETMVIPANLSVSLRNSKSALEQFFEEHDRNKTKSKR